jgi:hypothetical protein
METNAKEGRAIRRRWILCLRLAPVCRKEVAAAIRYGNINRYQSCIEFAVGSPLLQHVCVGPSGSLQLKQVSLSRDAWTGDSLPMATVVLRSQ